MLTANLRLPAFRVPTLDRRHWPATLVLATLLALYLVAGLNVIGMSGIDGRAAARVTDDLPSAVREQVLPTAEPLEFRRVDPTDAVAFNAAIPLASGPNPAATAFASRAQSQADRARALECLTSAIYYEAATEPTDGQRAVAAS